MTKGTHLLRSALLALLALAVISGGSLAAGDLFDDDYSDCPHKTRLRDGQISDLSVNRDSDEEDHVNVSWSATDPATWGLGANAYSTSLVVILDDGSSNTKTLSLGSRKTTFEGVDTGREVTVQMAIVVDTADGKYLISDILEKSINQSLTEPAFSRGILRVTRAAVGRVNASADGATPAVAAITETREATSGTYYYVGYNENFGNYKATGLTTIPSTARLRIGLAHSANESDDERDDVDFDAYILRITDEDGDVVSEGDDVSTIASSYGTARLWFGTYNGSLTADDAPKFSNVRINDGGEIRASIQDGGPAPQPNDNVVWTPQAVRGTGDEAITGLSYVWPNPNPVLAAVETGNPEATATGSGVIDSIFAMPPDEHRDFPIDVLDSDETYKITAWAINDDDEVISPVASLSLRPIDERQSSITILDDYLDVDGDDATARFADPDANVGVSNTIVTEFTVLK